MSISIILAFLIFGIISSVWIKKRKPSGTQSWIASAGSIFGWLSILSFLGLISAFGVSSSNIYIKEFLAAMPLPGAVMGIIAIIFGLISLAKGEKRNSLSAIILGAMSLIILIVLFISP